MEKNQKEYILREQLGFIRKELGEDSLSDAEGFEETLEELTASSKIKEQIKKEINRYKNLPSNGAESSVERSYIETLLEMPWDKVTEDCTDLSRAEKILERDHYGLEQVKTRILEFLAVRTLNQKEKPNHLRLGPLEQERPPSPEA